VSNVHTPQNSQIRATREKGESNFRTESSAKLLVPIAKGAKRTMTIPADPYTELNKRIQLAIAKDDYPLCESCEHCAPDLTEDGIARLAQIAVAQTQALASELCEQFDFIVIDVVSEGGEESDETKNPNAR
jgi:hypothetical protein